VAFEPQQLKRIQKKIISGRSRQQVNLKTRNSLQNVKYFSSIGMKDIFFLTFIQSGFMLISAGQSSVNNQGSIPFLFLPHQPGVS
jgi:hypothetical protein